MSSYTVVVQQDICIGAGLCAAESPGRFALTEEGIAEPLHSEYQELDEELLERARGCPSGAIEIFWDGAAVEVF